MLFISFGHRVAALGRITGRAILRANGWVALKGIEANNFTIPVVRFIDATKRFEKREVSTPPNSELDDDAGHILDSLIEFVKVKDLSQQRAAQVCPQIDQYFVVRNRRFLEQFKDQFARLDLLCR